jgi:hypothetical protein
MQVVDQRSPSSPRPDSVAMPVLGPDDGVGGAPALSRPVDLADWLTEELAQLIYALRQDLAEAAESPCCDPAEIDAVRDALLGVARRAHEIAAVLRSDACPRPAEERAAAFVAAISRDCDAARTLMARAASLV